MEKKFSVLMSVYINETRENFIECMESLLAQTVMPTEIVVVKDGPITQKLDATMDEYHQRYPELIRIVGYEKNRGLGYALAYGVKSCKYELIARMDTDDIARKDRFEKQLKEFWDNPELMICGSHIIEFVGVPQNVKAHRCVPLEDEQIRRNGKWRNPFNHMTVMFRKSKILEIGSYESCLLMEDYVLWAKALKSHLGLVKNIDDYLVYARAGDGLMERRGGISYLKKYIAGKQRMMEIGYINFFQFFFSILSQFIVSTLPLDMRTFMFAKFLRS